VDAVLEGVFDFLAGFADAGKDGARGVAAGLENAEEFAAADDVETGAFGGEEAEEGEIGVGFDGVADGVRGIGEGLFVAAEAFADGGGGVDVEGGAGFAGDGFEVEGIDKEMAVFVVKGGGEHYFTRRTRMVWSSNCFSPAENLETSA
jgi:hypothetical protein